MTFVYEFFKELVTKIKEFLTDIKTNIECRHGNSDIVIAILSCAAVHKLFIN